MKVISILFLSLILCSCYNNENRSEKIDELNRRITRLEQRIDSLLGIQNNGSSGLDIKSKDNSGSYGNTAVSGRCQSITKKGSQCRRKAKANGHCWQHGG
ncbi:MAG TPA: hypothetical protein VK489_08255 [Ferruginibacter sp.]|nr:hypothetical protein [Ferruginibacter sp.]